MESLHINDKEIQASIVAIRYWAMELQGRDVDLFTDNKCVYHYIKKWGGRIPRFQKLGKELWDLLQTQRLTITPHWVPSG